MNENMRSNMLAVYPLLLQKVAEIDGVKIVKEVGELAALMSAAKEKRAVAPTTGAVYVVFGGFEPVGSAGKGRFQVNRLFFTLVYCLRYTENSRAKIGAPQDGGMMIEVGRVLTNIKRELQGWDAGKDYVVEPFAETAPPAVEYNDGFAFYPVSFTCTVAVNAA